MEEQEILGQQSSIIESNQTQDYLNEDSKLSDTRISKKPIKNENKKPKKPKLITSLQGRPAKANPQLRIAEEKIKNTALLTAILEEELYVYHGGAEAAFDNNSNQLARNHIQSYFSDIIVIWDQMEQERQFIIDNPFDPLGMEFVPLSDKYFLNKFMISIQGEQQNQMAKYLIELDILFLVYSFQVRMRTNLKGFKRITAALAEIAQNAQPITLDEYDICNSLRIENVNLQYQDLTQFYTYLFKVLEDSCSKFKKDIPLNLITIQKGNELRSTYSLPNYRNQNFLIQDNMDLEDDY